MTSSGACPSCGVVLDARYLICPGCGRPQEEPGLAGSEDQPAVVVAPAHVPLATVQPAGDRRTVGVQVVAVAIVVLLIAAAGAAYWGWTVKQDLEATASRLDITRQEFDVAVVKIEEAQAGIFAGQAENAILSVQNDGLRAELAAAESLLANQSACIEGLQIDAAELQTIGDLQTANFNRNAEGSAWAEANNRIIDSYYEGFSAAYNGDYETANAWIREGNEAADDRTAAVEEIDVATAEIVRAREAWETSFAATAALCGG